MSKPKMVAAWCVEWQTRIMPAPAFWYYRNAIKADDAFWRLEKVTDIQHLHKRSARVPITTPFMDALDIIAQEKGVDHGS